MASATKLAALCLWLALCGFGMIAEAGHDSSSIVEPLIVTGMMALMLKNKKKHYHGRAPRYHRPPPPPPPPAQAYQPVQVVQEVQGEGPHEYESNHRSPRYDPENVRYVEERAVYPESRYVVRKQPRFVVAQAAPPPTTYVVPAHHVPQPRFVPATYGR